MPDLGALGEAYHQLREIEHTRMGARYTASMLDDTPVVVLAIAPDVAARIQWPDVFDAELQRAAAVHHEAIIPLLVWGSLSDGTLHCAYVRPDRDELVPGSLAPAVIAEIGVRLARALTASHAAGAVHGSITTSRIVMTRDRGAQLGDLGLFAALNAGGLGVHATSTLLSDQVYVSPEVQSGNAPDECSDVYSLGASLYELLTGKPPYGGRTTNHVLASVLSPESGGGATEAATNAVVDAIVRAIEHGRADRWPDAAAFAAALAAGIAQPRGSPPTSRRGCVPKAAAALAIASAAIVAANS